MLLCLSYFSTIVVLHLFTSRQLMEPSSTSRSVHRRAELGICAVTAASETASGDHLPWVSAASVALVMLHYHSGLLWRPNNPMFKKNCIIDTKSLLIIIHTKLFIIKIINFWTLNQSRFINKAQEMSSQGNSAGLSYQDILVMTTELSLNQLVLEIRFWLLVK